MIEFVLENTTMHKDIYKYNQKCLLTIPSYYDQNDHHMKCTKLT